MTDFEDWLQSYKGFAEEFFQQCQLAGIYVCTSTVGINIFDSGPLE